MAALSRSKRTISLSILLTVGWVSLWFVPWQLWLGSLPWLQLVIATTAFIIPGACVYHLIYTGQPPRLSAYITVGFALGVTCVGFTGLIARLVHLPFLVVYYSLFVVGAISLVLVILDQERLPHLRWSTLDRSLLRTVVIALPTIAMVGAAAVLSARPFWGGDKYTYTALITNRQHSTSLDFRQVFYGTEHLFSVRYWLSFFPMTVAVLSSLSGVHGLLLSAIYLRPALVVLSCLAIYELARSLGLSASTAALAVIAQLFFLFLLTDDLQPGLIFAERMEEDKVVTSYMLSPILIRMIKGYLDKRSWQQFLLLFLVGLSLTFTHPTAMGIACLIGGLFSLLNLLATQHLKPFLAVQVVLLTILAAPFSLRFFDNATTSVYSQNFSIQYRIEENTDFTLARTNVLEGSRWYGFQPRLFMVTVPFDPTVTPTFTMKVIRNSIFGLVALTSILAVSRLKKRRAVDHYLIAGSIVLLLAVVPYTGWILGMMITPLHLWRVPWQFPYGIAFSSLITVIQRPDTPDQPHSDSESSGVVAWAAPIAIAYILAAAGLAWMPRAFEALTLSPVYQNIEYAPLIEMGRTLDQLISEQAIVLGDRGLNPFLPSLSSHAKVIMHRNARSMALFGLSPEEAEQREAAYNRIVLDESLPPTERIALMQQYHVAYVLIQDDSAESQKILRRTQEHLRLVDTHDGLSLFEFTPYSTE